MKRKIPGILLALTLLFLTACAATADRPVQPNEEAPSTMNQQVAGRYKKITPEEAKTKMDAGNVTIVDVRTQSEYDEGYIPGAILVPNETIGDTLPEALPNQEAVLLVYCRSGRRSKEAAEKLAALGYQTVYDFGGILDWPYDIERP